MEVSHMHPRTLGQSQSHIAYPSLHSQDMYRIMSGTIKDNICFSHHYDDTFYNLVLDGERHHLNAWFPDLHPFFSLRTQTGLGSSF